MFWLYYIIMLFSQTNKVGQFLDVKSGHLLILDNTSLRVPQFLPNELSTTCPGFQSKNWICQDHAVGIAASWWYLMDQSRTAPCQWRVFHPAGIAKLARKERINRSEDTLIYFGTKQSVQEVTWMNYIFRILISLHEQRRLVGQCPGFKKP